MKEELGQLDSITLRFWRVTNALWRPLLALAIAIVIQLAIDAVVSISLNTSGIGDLTFSPVVQDVGCRPSVPFGEGVCFHPIPHSIVKLGIRVLLSIVIGLVVSELVVQRSQPRPVTSSLITAGLYAAIAIALVEFYPDGVIRGLSRTSGTPVVQTLGYELGIAVTLLAAWWWAKRRVMRRSHH